MIKILPVGLGGRFFTPTVRKSQLLFIPSELDGLFVISHAVHLTFKSPLQALVKQKQEYKVFSSHIIYSFPPTGVKSKILLLLPKAINYDR